MTPEETGRAYDEIAAWWREQHRESHYGLTQLQRAIDHAKTRGPALDVGCGSEGRFLAAMRAAGFEPEGLDISPQMIAEARRHRPEFLYHQANIVEWPLPRPYHLITAWDSIFHLPLPLHEPVLRKLCEGLVPGGILLFTCGGTDHPDSITGSFAGQEFGYSSPGISAILKILDVNGCQCRHLEFDQWPENHVAIIARRNAL